MAYIGLDVGTTGCKATVVDEQGRGLYQEYCEYDLSHPREGWVELDPRVVWQGVQRVLGRVAASYQRPVEALSIASFGEAAVMLDERGELLGDSIFFTDVRGSEYVAEICARLGRDELQKRTGMPVNGMYTLPKLLWIQQHEPERLARLRKLMPFGSYIAYMLTGEAAVDGSLASRMLLFDAQKLAWDEAALAAFSLDAAWLPRYVPAGAPVGQIRPQVAEELGLNRDLMVVSGVHDQIAAALGSGSTEPGDASDGIGSAECISAVLEDGADLTALFPHNICAEPHGVPGQRLALIFNSTAGASLKWYRNEFEDVLHERCKRDGLNTYEALNQKLGDAPSPLLFLPHMAGTGTPYMDPQAKGMLVGLTLDSSRPQIYRAIIEGMNFEMRYNLELLGACGMRPGRLTATGGGSASRDVLQIKADILQLPIATTQDPQSGTIGLAVLCAVATGRFASVAEAAKALVEIEEIIEPRAQNRDRYDEMYACYKRLYAAGRTIYGR